MHRSGLLVTRRLRNPAGRFGDFAEMTAEQWDGLRRTNIDAFVYLTQQALHELVRSGGNLVAVGSVSGVRGDWVRPATTPARR